MKSFKLSTRIAAFAIAGAALSMTPALAQTTPSTDAPAAEAPLKDAPAAGAVSLTGKIAAAGEKAGTFTLKVGEADAVKDIAVDASAATSDGQPFAIGDEVTVTGTLSADETSLKASSLAKTNADKAAPATDTPATGTDAAVPAEKPAKEPAQ
ncbi:hypothetical protein PQU92_16615 [Asticcacaulis sp. BYS171W]|uniref:DUF5666 domain-containing protein n=1 Tax=Asticcacaulis aquaticus TaxID=2984212 RepID=A0ABT5HY99_9CAUL|nr:hypothetical protein [Asticcacaulis aquaticus]MDC7684908.1 hypothetical protein [Asticcacaulis aquaticus]